MEIVTEADKERIAKGLADAEALEIELEKATKAGIDVSDQTARLRVVKAKWLKLKEVYIISA